MQREATYTSRCRDVHRACMRGGGAAVCRAACVRSIAWNAMGHCQTRDRLECEMMAGMFIPQLRIYMRQAAQAALEHRAERKLGLARPPQQLSRRVVGRQPAPRPRGGRVARRRELDADRTLEIRQLEPRLRHERSRAGAEVGERAVPAAGVETKRGKELARTDACHLAVGG